MFGIFCLSNGVFVLLFLPETKRMTLEEIDVLFGADADARAKEVEANMEDVHNKSHSIEFHENGQTERVESQTPAKQ